MSQSGGQYDMQLLFFHDLIGDLLFNMSMQVKWTVQQHSTV